MKKRDFTGCSSIQNVLNETIDGRRRIIEYTNDSVSDSKSCEIPTGGKRAFTLAEVLITLAIIGVVAAISIPSVISNSQQQEFKTGLRKAVSVLNSAITMNMAIDGESPYENKDLFNYLQRHMAIMATTSKLENKFISYTITNDGTIDRNENAAFYTTDGMRFEFASHHGRWRDMPLHETNNIFACNSTSSFYGGDTCNGCGSYGLKSNSNGTTEPPCLILVDVNGDRKPTPGNAFCLDESCGSKSNLYKIPLPNEKKLRDTFPIMITDSGAIPYGITAQKAMYDAQK